MEDTLRVKTSPYGKQTHGLNPCFNGRYSQSSVDKPIRGFVAQVLILVLMEDTLRVLERLFVLS